MVCKQPLSFPNDIGIADFVVLMIQFYKIHDLCENLARQNTPAKKIVKKKGIKHGSISND